MRHAFQVDLRGVVDLLSHHLYTSPRVYVRELMQNAVDAVTARKHLDDFTPRIVLEPSELTPDGVLRIRDNGIGLTEDEVHELLATIGRSSKKDELGFARHEFLGQFGIGLLSCFMVADEIEVVTRSATAKGAGAATVRWHGHGDGHYTVTEGPPRPEPGTTVSLRARPGCAHWLNTETVTDLAYKYGGFLPFDIRVGAQPITDEGPPWLQQYASVDDRNEALQRYGSELLGSDPLGVVDLEVPEAGLTGVAFVQPAEAHPGRDTTHHVYLKRMLLGDRVEDLLPEWAFFVQCVVDTSELHPTANREQLYKDELLESTREALGNQVRDWLVRLATTSPEDLHRFLGVHDRGVRALAIHDDDMLRVVDRWMAFETCDGWMTLTEFRQRYSKLHYTGSSSEFRQLTSVAAAQGIGLINGGYEYVTDILQRLQVIEPDIVLERLAPADLATKFDLVDPDAEAMVSAFIDLAREPLGKLGCEPTVRAFDPPSLPALYLDNAEARVQVDIENARAEAKGPWADLIDSDGTAPATPPRAGFTPLVLNYRNPVVRRALTLRDPALVTLTAEAVYAQALLAGQRPLRPADVAALNRSFLGLLERAIN